MDEVAKLAEGEQAEPDRCRLVGLSASASTLPPSVKIADLVGAVDGGHGTFRRPLSRPVSIRIRCRTPTGHDHDYKTLGGPRSGMIPAPKNSRPT